ncbi:MAG: cysteine--tRNA ligase [Euryarchaeota archaeon]|nr:cysteine--tRNA ligase [Euryarchaeota archaeon]
MGLQVFNSLTGRKEPLETLEKGHVRLYVCGLTVYDYAHIGHARTYVAFDVAKRYMLHRGLRVTHVQNVTDVDDKIIKRAAETGEDPVALAARFTREAERDLDLLSVSRADHYPKVTSSMHLILSMIQRLIERGYAYQAAGSVYFRVRKLADYGKLSKIDPEEMLNEVRKEAAEGKEDPLDFALWKRTKAGEVAWGSPWGEGRPGWHIECSAMSGAILGDTFDIHGGGMDLKFPHHENEIAQSEAATGKPFVKYWMHTGFLTVSGEKMSKSLGNFVTIRDLLKDHDPHAVRLFMVSTHYRSPIDYSPESITQAEKNVERIVNMLGNVEHAKGKARAGEMTAVDKKFHEGLAAQTLAFQNAMDNDFATPEALAAIFQMVNDMNGYAAADPHRETLDEATTLFKGLADVFGIVPEKKAGGGESLAKVMELVIQLRAEARARKDYATSDKIRKTLQEAGIIVEDTADGVKWRVG